MATTMGKKLFLTLLCMHHLALDLSWAQSLRGGHFPCQASLEGQVVTVPMTGGTVVRCRCRNGILDQCINPKCDQALDGCHYVETRTNSSCPRTCKSCFDSQGTHHASGSFWQDEAQPCQTSQCFSGVITSTSLQCPKPMCSNPVQLPGQCCPSCPGCQMALEDFAEGETKPSVIDPCTDCTCQNGRLSCARRACPVLPCEARLIKNVPGQCCPVCARQHEAVTNIKDMCVFRGKVFSIGSMILKDDCTKCTCNPNLTIECQSETCSTLACLKSEQVKVPGTCCATCSNSKSAAARRPTSCEYEGRHYSHGESWSDQCNDCRCFTGETMCTKRQCPTLKCGSNEQMEHPAGSCCPKCVIKEGVCTVFGDPHYKTFDGRIFNFQGSCKYLLAKDCGNGNGSNSSFSIRITNDARDSMAFSWLRTITVRMDDMKISLMQKMKVKVNGAKVNLPYLKLGSLSIMKDGYRIILRTNEGVRIIWDGVSFLELTVPSKFSNRMCGLCGNFNNDRFDDFYGRDGHYYHQDQDFGNTWRVGGYRACSVLPRDMPHHYQPQCKQSWETKIKSDRNCNAFNSTLFHACRKLVDPSYYYNACKLDMCECPGNTCHCEVLTAYARECERAGIIVYDWRAATDCTNVSSFSWKDRSSLFDSSSMASSNNSVEHQVSSSDKDKNNVDSADMSFAIGDYLPGCTLANAKECQNQAKESDREQRVRERQERKKMRRRLRKLRRQQKRRNMRKVRKKLMSSSRRRKNSGKRERRKKQKRPRKLKWNSEGVAPFESLLSAESDTGDDESSAESTEVVEVVHPQPDLTTLLASDKLRTLPSKEVLASRKPLPLLEHKMSTTKDFLKRRSTSEAKVLRHPSFSLKNRRNKNWKRRRRSTW